MGDDKIKSLEKKLKAFRSKPNQGASGRKKVGVLNDLAYALYRSDPEKAETYGSQALALAEKLGFKKGIAESHGILGTSFWVRGNYDKALECYTESLNICEQTGDRKGVASCYTNIGLIHKTRSNYEQALEYHLKALKIKEEIEDKPGTAKCYNNIGIIYDERGDYNHALEYYLAALKIFEEIGDRQGVAFSYNNIGVVYETRGDYDQALAYHLKSLKIKEEIGDKKGIADSYSNIGAFYEERGNYDQALEYCLNALEIFEEIGDKRETADLCNSIGGLHTRLKRYDTALSYLQKGLQIAREIGAKRWEMASCEYLSRLYEAQGDFEESLTYCKRCSEIKEKIFSEESAAKIAQMQVKYETERKEQEAENYRLKSIELEREMSERKRSEKELQKARTELEERVKKRTAELEAAYDELLKEIFERNLTEENLRGSEKKHRLLLESIQSPVLALTWDMRVFYCNQSYADFAALPVSELEEKSMTELFPEFEHTRFYQAYQEVIETGKSKEIEERIGDSYVQAFIYPMPWGILEITVDITERKLAVGALRESQERYRAVSELISDFAYSIRVEPDAGFVLEWATEAFTRLTGLPSKGLNFPGDLLNIVHPDDKAAFSQGFDVLLSGRTKVREYRIFTENGNVRYLLDFAHPVIEQAQGCVKRIYGAAQDITERKLAEKALLESEERYRTLVETAKDIILIHDLQDKLIYVNTSGLKISGYSKEEVERMRITDFIPADQLQALKERREKRLAGDTGVHLYATEFVNKAGRLIPVEVSSSLLSKDGKPWATFLIARDITERKRAEDTIKASLAEKEVLLKEIHHRVKNNLQIISSLLKLQVKHIGDAEAVESLRQSRDRIGSIALIHEKLYRSKDLARVDFPEYVRDLVASLFRSYGMSSTDIKLRVNVGDVRMSIDRAIPCALIINELVANSLEHAFPEGKKGEICVELVVEHNEMLKLTVADNGIGLPEGLDPMAAETLGLELVETLAAQLGGQVACESRAGTAFTIIFPVDKSGSREVS
jgi:PAS domain S-box-containing protein